MPYHWSPVVITVPYTESAPGVSNTILTISLTNNLSFAAGTGTNTVPTSLVIVGQLGGGLGAAPVTTPSPPHAAQGPTWPLRAVPIRLLIAAVSPAVLARVPSVPIAHRLSRTASSRSPLKWCSGRPRISPGAISNLAPI